MLCAPRTAVFSIALILFAYRGNSFGALPTDAAEPGDSLNGPDFGIGAVIDHLEWASFPDGRVVVPSLKAGHVTGSSRDTAVQADAMLGAIMLARDSRGNATILSIDAFRRLPNNLAVYTLSRRVDLYSDALKWATVCTDQSGKATEGVFLPGHWDEKTGEYFDDGFTFGCAGGALVKCAEAGYSAWDPDLLPYALACVRMIRADYCGDGISHTREGTPISFGDSFGIHYLTSDPAWLFEAIWTKKGASCIGTVPAAGDSLTALPIKRWVNLFSRPDSQICQIPACSSDTYVPTSLATLSSACRPNASQPTKCAPWYFVPSP